MSIVLITGSAGLVGSEAALHFASLGHDVVGIDNDMRAYFFGTSTAPRAADLRAQLGKQYNHQALDIRNGEALHALFRQYGREINLVIHAAAQPSHDWAAREPVTDFSVNALGTLHLLESVRQHAPEAVFCFVSTNKVYGNGPNRIPLMEGETRYEPYDRDYYEGVRETFPVDHTLHSLFGASKLAADILTQEYGLYFGLKTGIFRCGCLTGAGHAGAEQHGFLAYLAACVKQGRPYTVYGYQGKQVRDNLHARDLARAFEAFFGDPNPGAVYNLGGGRENSISVIEAIAAFEHLAGKDLPVTVDPRPRKGDHQWYITDTRLFRSAYPGWRVEISLREILEELLEREVAAA